MIGIYSWKNKINGKRYIGQSVDIERRKKQHITGIGKYQTKISQALAYYSLENFDFEIIEECSIEKLNERETYWIHYYDTIKNGYNITDNCADGPVVIGECNPNTKLKNDDVLTIRNRIHINKENIADVYKDYKDKISYSSFWNLVHGVTWKNIDTSMIKPLPSYKFSTETTEGSKNIKATITENEVLNIRNQIYKEGKDSLDVYQQVKDKISYSAYLKMVKGITWKNVDTSMITNLKVTRKNKPKAKLNKELVKQIRYEYENNIKTLSELYKEYNYVTPATIKRVVEYQTWKNI